LLNGVCIFYRKSNKRKLLTVIFENGHLVNSTQKKKIIINKLLSEYKKRYKKIYAIIDSSVTDDESSAKLSTYDNNSKDELTCVICYENKKNIMFKDCKHIAVCNICSKKIKDCPICRKKIKKKPEIVYIS